jgi:transposase-like protein
VVHVIDAVLDSFYNLFRSHRYSPLEKIYSVTLFIAGLSLRDLSERLRLTGASREFGQDMSSRVLFPLQAFQKGRRFGKRNGVEMWFREMKKRTKRFYNNVNSKKLKCIEELVTAIAAMHSIIRAGGEEVIPT